MPDDISFLSRAIEIASAGVDNGGGPFGAVITKDGEILSESCNMVVLNHDPTAHAEMLAIREAAARIGTFDLHECTLYASCEPCPMCLGAIYWSGIRKVIYASDRNDAEKAGFSDKMIYEEIDLDPSERRIPFIRMTDKGAGEVFRKWKNMDDKIQY
ncbi:MAG TPA: nucleoside deaminase [Bacteroidales bacterium]|nr:nucleoside deaminase [Bacteroidales bacterium]